MPEGADYAPSSAVARYNHRDEIASEKCLPQRSLARASSMRGGRSAVVVIFVSVGVERGNRHP
jgi:hypothetical protein